MGTPFSAVPLSLTEYVPDQQEHSRNQPATLDDTSGSLQMNIRSAEYRGTKWGAVNPRTDIGIKEKWVGAAVSGHREWYPPARGSGRTTVPHP